MSISTSLKIYNLIVNVSYNSIAQIICYLSSQTMYILILDNISPFTKTSLIYHFAYSNNNYSCTTLYLNFKENKSVTKKNPFFFQFFFSFQCFYKYSASCIRSYAVKCFTIIFNLMRTLFLCFIVFISEKNSSSSLMGNCLYLQRALNFGR